MTTVAAELVVEIAGRERNASALITRIRDEMRRAEEEAKRLQAAFAGLGAGTNAPARQPRAPTAPGAPAGGGGGGDTGRAANEALRLASAQARLAVAQGDTSRATNILNTALSANTGASQRAALGVQTTIARLESGRTIFQQFGDAAKGSLLGILGPAALVATAIGAISQVGDLIKLGAQADQTRQRFDGLAKSAGTTGEALLTALRSASAGTISDLNLELAANRAQLLGVADSAEEFSVLMDIARARAQDMGISTTQAFNDLVTGLGRGSALILDNLGITVSVTEANKAYAAQLGKNVATLTEAEQKTALINAVLTQGKASLDAAGGALETNATKVERLAANWENLTAKIGGFLAQGAGPVVDALNQMAVAADRASAKSDTLLSSASNYTAYAAAVKRADDAQLAQVRSASQGVPNRLPALTEAQFNYAKALEATGVSAAAARAQAVAMNGTLIQVGQIQAVVARQSGLSTNQLDLLSNTILRLKQSGGEGAAQIDSLVAAFLRGDLSARDLAAAAQQIEPALAIQAQAARDAAVAAQIHASGMDQEINAAIQSGLAARQQAQATADAAIQIQIDTQAKAEQTAQTELMNAKTQEAVNAFLALNPNLSASGAAAAASAAGFPPLIGQLIEATIRAQEARNALAAFNALAGVQALRAPGSAGGGPTGEDEIRADRRRSVIEDRNARVAAGTAAAEAEARYQDQIGNSSPLLARRQAELAQLTKGSAAYFDKLREIDQIESAGTRKGGGGGAGAGAARLSDQQRLNNTLLGDQDRYHDQAEQAEREHTKRVLEIQAEFEKRSLEQQRANEVGKRQSRADFYDSLTSATKDVGQEVAQELSAAYEQAYAKSQEIAESGNQKLAADYLALKQQQIQTELDFQKQLAEARENKDKGEIARLEQIHKLRQEAQAEEEKQLLAGGDANVKQRDEALGAEDQRFIEQQGKNANSAEQAAERKIAAAQRSGKEIDAENLKLEQQEAILKRIGARAPGGAEAGTPAAAGAGTPTAAPAADDLASIAQALSDIASRITEAITKASGDITRAQKDTTSAVKGLNGRVMS